MVVNRSWAEVAGEDYRHVMINVNKVGKKRGGGVGSEGVSTDICGSPSLSWATLSHTNNLIIVTFSIWK